MKGGYVELSVYLACLSFILNFYASFITIRGVFGHLLVFIVISCGLFFVLLRYRVPKPKESTVRKIFGCDWGAYSSIMGDKKCDDDYTMKVVAHRACGLDAPENSLSALDKVKKEGITAVEFDVLMTADDVPVVFHDSTLSRMTDVNHNVRETLFEDLSKLDISVKHPFGKNFVGEKIPKLIDYVTYCLNNDIRMFVDLKNAENNIVNVITDIFKKFPKMYECAVVSSFNPILIYQIRTKDPDITCSLAWRPYYYSHEEYNEKLGPDRPRTNNIFTLMILRVLNVLHQWALWKFGYYLLGLSALLLHKDMVTRDMIQYWNTKGIRVIAWSVNLPTEKQYFEKILQITYLTDTVINS